MTGFYTLDRNCAQLSTLPECTTVEVPSCFLGTRGHIRMAYLCNSRAGKYSDRCCSVMYVFLSKLLRMMIAACVHACGFVHWLAGGDITENAAPSLANKTQPYTHIPTSIITIHACSAGTLITKQDQDTWLCQTPPGG